MKCSSPVRRFQCRGAALLMFVMVGVIAASALMLKALNVSLPQFTQASDSRVLKTARQALLGYAVSFAERNAGSMPGYLPCPDLNGDGLAEVSCGAAGRSVIGRLPWRTLGLQPLRDSAGDCLWYAVSGDYKENPANLLATDANGQFLVVDSELNPLNGAHVDNAAIAVVFAAGKALSGQNRSVSTNNATECGSQRVSDGINLSRHHLDTHNGINNATGTFNRRQLLGVPVVSIGGNGYSAFIASYNPAADSAKGLPASFNDVLISITPQHYEKIYTQMQVWVGNRVRQCLKQYSDNNSGKLPWPALLNTGGLPGFNDNSLALRFGRFPANLANSAGHGLSSLWPMDPLQPGVRCFSWGWWPGFQENTFYAIDPVASATGVPGAFTLQVDGSASAAAVIVAGREGAAQVRTNSLTKSLISNYLETENIVDMASGLLPPGDQVFVSSDRNAAFFNDYVCTLESCP